MTTSPHSRRGFLRGTSAAGLSILGTSLPVTSALAAAKAAKDAATDPWREAQAIVNKLANVVKFRKKDYLVTDFGAATCKLVKVNGWASFEGEGEQAALSTPASGSKDCYPAFRDAIARCNKEGGGRVVIPKGDWFCAGPIVLLSNVNVHLQAGAHVYFSNDPRDYAKYGDVDCGENGKLVVTRWQSNDCLNFASMIYAHNQNNIALTADDWTAILDGQGGTPFEGSLDCWWTWKGKGRTLDAAGRTIYPDHKPNGITQNKPNPLNPKSLAEIAPDLPEAQRALIQGEGDGWRTDEAYLPALSEAGVPLEKRVFGLGHYLRP
jgi:polygalacturonase